MIRKVSDLLLDVRAQSSQSWSDEIVAFVEAALEKTPVLYARIVNANSLFGDDGVGFELYSKANVLGTQQLAEPRHFDLADPDSIRHLVTTCEEAYRERLPLINPSIWPEQANEHGT